jgi:phosphate uptake regulator
MKRKVIQLANNTLVMSIPAAWVKKTKISKGDSINVEEAGDMLLVSPEGRTVSMSFTIDADQIAFNKNMLSYLYQKGYDQIEVVNLNADMFKQIKERTSELLGFEIIEHSEKRCLIKAVSKEMESEFDNLLRRTFLITLEMARHLHDAIAKNEHQRIVEIRNLEKTKNTFTDFCKRILSKGSYKDPENTTYMYVIIRDLEKIADYYKRICDVFLTTKDKPNISKKTLDLINKTNAFFEMFYKLFYKFNPETFKRFQSEGKSMISAANSLLKTASHEESRIINNIISITTTTYDLSGPYFILNFDLIK